MHEPDDFDVGLFVTSLLADFPGLEFDPAFIDKTADEVRAGKVSDAPWDEVKGLQRPLPDGALTMVPAPPKPAVVGDLI